MEITDEQIQAIRDWAASEIGIKAVYLFGSRAKGNAYGASDADIALALNVSDDRVNDLFFMNGQFWQDDLRERTGLLINLARLAGDLTPVHTAAVADHGVQLWPEKE